MEELRLDPAVAHPRKACGSSREGVSKLGVCQVRRCTFTARTMLEADCAGQGFGKTRTGRAGMASQGAGDRIALRGETRGPNDHASNSTCGSAARCVDELVSSASGVLSRSKIAWAWDRTVVAPSWSPVISWS